MVTNLELQIKIWEGPHPEGSHQLIRETCK